MLSAARSLVLGCAVAWLTPGCGGPSRVAGGPTGEPARPEPVPIERVVVEDRPPLTLVARGGDPQAAAAFVARHGRGGPASAALLGLVAGRLESAGVSGFEARAHGLGIELSRLVASEDELSRFFAAVQRSLAAPVRAGEPALARAKGELASLSALRFAGPGEAAVARCSGELGLGEGPAAPDLSSAAGLGWLEAVRNASFRADAAAFAVLGGEALLSAAADALEDSDSWPSEGADEDPWPESDFAAVDREGGTRQLSLALWLPDADAAVFAGASLASPGSELLVRLEHLTPAWRLTRASAIARQRGACLRLDVTPRAAGDPGPPASEVALVAALVERSARAALAQAEPGALDESVLRPSDPRRAALLAAWRGLPSGDAREEPRRSVAYIGGPSDSLTSADLARALENARARLLRPSVEVSERLESGQGELWLLLASPCGTAAETLSDAGAFALTLRTLAENMSGRGVRFEPWITPDGVGLLAHGPRLSPSEPALTQASRIAAALGRALTAPLDGAALGSARAELLKELGGRPFPGFALALEGLAPDHPSWLEPRGLFRSVSELPTEGLERARRLLLSSPLRLSVLSSAAAQARAASIELESWLSPLRSEPRDCAVVRPEAPRRGQARVEAPRDGAFEGAYVAVALGSPGADSARIAELSALLLNRNGGLLERALASGGGAGTARAHALGGTRRPALLVDVRALPERLPDAVGRVRNALDQLARGAVRSDDYAEAARELERLELQARFDPRRRIVDLWRAEPLPQPNLAAVRAAQAGLGSAAHWVVNVVPGP